jgi:hypothetical protein
VCIRTVGVRATLIYWASANPTWAGCITISLSFWVELVGACNLIVRTTPPPHTCVLPQTVPCSSPERWRDRGDVPWPSSMQPLATPIQVSAHGLHALGGQEREWAPPMPWSTIGHGDSCEGNLAVRWMREGGGCDGGLVEKIKRRWTAPRACLLWYSWTWCCGRWSGREAAVADRQRREGDGDSGGEKRRERERERWSVLHVGPCWARVTGKPPKLG